MINQIYTKYYEKLEFILNGSWISCCFIAR